MYRLFILPLRVALATFQKKVTGEIDTDGENFKLSIYPVVFMTMHAIPFFLKYGFPFDNEITVIAIIFCTQMFAWALIARWLKAPLDESALESKKNILLGVFIWLEPFIFLSTCTLWHWNHGARF
jgi:hypothetical protein